MVLKKKQNKVFIETTAMALNAYDKLVKEVIARVCETCPGKNEHFKGLELFANFCDRESCHFSKHINEYYETLRIRFAEMSKKMDE